MINALIKEQLEIECLGTGETTEKAVEDALRDMRVQVVERLPYPIISISTTEVYVLDEQTQTTKEAFLYFFAKREKVQKKVKLKLKLDVSYLKIERGK